MSRNWEPGTKMLVAELEARFPNVIDFSTYRGHGTAGERWSVDCWIADYGRFPTPEQEDVGDRVQRYVLRNWHRIGVGYVIWWRYAIQDDEYRVFGDQPAHTWFDYRPYALAWLADHPGDEDPQTYFHYDHLHITRRPGATYWPKES